MARPWPLAVRPERVVHPPCARRGVQLSGSA
jgi:hypothetical protein